MTSKAHGIELIKKAGSSTDAEQPKRLVDRVWPYLRSCNKAGVAPDGGTLSPISSEELCFDVGDDASMRGGRAQLENRLWEVRAFVRERQERDAVLSTKPVPEWYESHPRGEGAAQPSQGSHAIQEIAGADDALKRVRHNVLPSVPLCNALLLIPGSLDRAMDSTKLVRARAVERESASP